MRTQPKRLDTLGDQCGVNNTTGKLEQKKTTSWFPVDRETNIKCSGPDQIKYTFQ